MGKALRRTEPALHEADLPAARHPRARPHRGRRARSKAAIASGSTSTRWRSAAACAPTSPASSRWRRILAPLGVEVLGYDLPLWMGEEACLHLMSVISPLADDLALVYSPLLPAAFYQLLKARGIRLVEGDAQEFTASNGLSLNVLPTSPASGDRGGRLSEDRGGDGGGRLHGADLRGRCAVHRLRRRPDLPDPADSEGMSGWRDLRPSPRSPGGGKVAP